MTDVDGSIAMAATARGAPLTPLLVADDDPPAGWVTVEVVAAGVCHADLGTARPAEGTPLPVVPGHEVAGVAASAGIRPIVERMPHTAANEAVARVAVGAARFRVVLEPRAGR